MQQVYEQNLTLNTSYQSRLSARSFFTRYAIAALLYVTFFSGIAYFSNGIRSLSDDLSWKESFVPSFLTKSGSFEHLTLDESFSVAVLDMDSDFPYPGDQRKQPQASVDIDKEIVVIGRYGYQDKTSYVLADMTGSFSQTCMVQTGGVVTGIAHDDSNVLLSYTPPPGGRTGIGSCNGNEIFFMPWNHT